MSADSTASPVSAFRSPISADAVTSHLAKVQALHERFASLTGNRVYLGYSRIAAWHEFVRRGLTAEDLETVVRYIRREMGRAGSGYSPASLQFSRLIGDTDLFEDRLNLARESWRKAKTARPDPPSSPVSDIRSPVSQEAITHEEAAGMLADFRRRKRH